MKEQRRILSQSSERARPRRHLSLDFWVQNFEGINFCYKAAQTVVLCYSSLGNLHTVLRVSCPFYSLDSLKNPIKEALLSPLHKTEAQKSCPSICAAHTQQSELVGRTLVASSIHLTFFCNNSSIFLWKETLSL